MSGLWVLKVNLAKSNRCFIWSNGSYVVDKWHLLRVTLQNVKDPAYCNTTQLKCERLNDSVDFKLNYIPIMEMHQLCTQKQIPLNASPFEGM